MRLIRLRPAIRLALAAACAAVAAYTVAGAAGPVAAVAAGSGTPLPAGWELCVLQGVTAPLTQANVDDLDQWQVAEGGSTNNTAAYNPFNTERTTDVHNAPLPEVTSANGFPAFSNWLAGCAATVATMLQPNMWSVTAALRAGNVAPPAAFLAAVDQSQWCAPSADGTPCYASAILGAAGSVAAGLLVESSALQVYGNVKDDVRTYQNAETAWTADQGALTARDQDLAAADVGVSNAQNGLKASAHRLEKVAVEEYVTNGLYASGSYVNPKSTANPLRPQNADGVIAQQYDRIVVSDLVATYQRLVGAVKASLARRQAASQAVAQATATLAAQDAVVKRSLVRLLGDVDTMQKAGACTTVSITTSVPLPVAPPTPATPPTATIATTVPSPTTTTTTVAPPAPTTPTSTTSTTIVPSIVPTTTTTTSTTTTTTTTTLPTPAAPSTTTTTTVPDAGPAPQGATPPSASPAGLNALQGCISGFAPTAA
jgi:hypothetical protein